MASSDTHQRIMDAAERLFAERGYAGASMRRIVTEAGVHLAAVNYHFGSKRELFGAVLERRLRPLDEQRIDALDALEAEAGDDAVGLESLLEAMIEPALRIACSEGPGALWPRFAARSRLEPSEHWDRAERIHEPMVRRYLRAFRRALPDLPPREVAYRFYFFAGTFANALIDTRTLKLLGGLPGLREDPQGVRARLIAFVAAGMRAPVSGQGQPSQRSRSNVRHHQRVTDT